MTDHPSSNRHLGLLGATGVGVGAIVGGGILALSGVAFATTGPAALIAFALNGVIAILTALSFAEMASKFPESGGTYTFAKKVLSVESAFMVGWVVWFASIVAAVLYALGFAYFLLVMIDDLWTWQSGVPHPWLQHSWTVTGVSLVSTIVLALVLARSARGGGQAANIGKVFVFVILVLGGFWALTRESPADITSRLQPFFSAGFYGLIQAMGYTFIALQGFDLIAAVGGEVRNPVRNIPRAMLLSLGIALAIYLPLLFVVATVGVPVGESIAPLSAAQPESIVAVAAQNFLGPFGYWLVIVAAVLSMFSALQANLFAASRIARAMALDRNLPSPIARMNRALGTPLNAILVTTLLVSALLIVLPDVSAAGAASSLIFLLTFALAHWAAILVRQRSALRPPPFRTPLFPIVPVLGGLACLGLAIFQGIAVPAAGLIAIIWLGIGGGLFLGIFARRARIMDASSTALDPELVTLRGQSPLVLAPIANPQSAEAMMAMANSLVPSYVGRVLALTVAKVPEDWRPEEDSAPVDRAQTVLSELLRSSARLGRSPEAITTVATDPMAEIARVARLHRCQTVLLGFGDIADHGQMERLEQLFGALRADIVVMRMPPNWKLSEARRILVPVAGRGGHNNLLARLLGSLTRSGQCTVTFLHVTPPGRSAQDHSRIQRDLRRLAADTLHVPAAVRVVEHDDPIAAITEQLPGFDLTILGMQRVGEQTKLFTDFTLRLASCTDCPLVVISRRA